MTAPYLPNLCAGHAAAVRTLQISWERKDEHELDKKNADQTNTERTKCNEKGFYKKELNKKEPEQIPPYLSLNPGRSEERRVGKECYS